MGNVVWGGQEIETPTALDVLLDGFRGTPRGRHAEGTPVFERRDGIKRVRSVGRDQVHDTGGMESENAFQRRRRGFDDLDRQLSVVAGFLKDPNCMDFRQGVRMLRAC